MTAAGMPGTSAVSLVPACRGLRALLAARAGARGIRDACLAAGRPAMAPASTSGPEAAR